jgi:hypothetical protein
MKYIGRAFLIALIFIFLSSPQVSRAAWWNPATWGTNKSQLGIVGSSTKSDEVIKERIIERTVQVDNPVLQKKIADLLAENANLRSQISSQSNLVAQLNECRASVTTFNNPATKTGVTTVESSAYQKRQNNLEELDRKMSEALDTLGAIIDSHEALTSAPQAVVEKFMGITSAIADINSIMALYRLTDSSFKHAEFRITDLESLRAEYIELSNYLPVYQKYRP